MHKQSNAPCTRDRTRGVGIVGVVAAARADGPRSRTACELPAVRCYSAAGASFIFAKATYERIACTMTKKKYGGKRTIATE